jgi:hypothetical protein
MELDEIEKNYGSNQKFRRINAKDFRQGNKVYLFRIALVSFFFVLYFLISFTTNFLLIGDISILNDIYNVTSLGYPNFTLAFNILREKVINENLTLFNDNSTDILKTTIKDISLLNNEITSVIVVFKNLETS